MRRGGSTAQRNRLQRMAMGLLVVSTAALSLATLQIGFTLVDDDRDGALSADNSLAYLRASLERGSATSAQQVFPEGYFFSYVLYGLAWANLAHSDLADPATARADALWALEHLDSPEGRGPFERSLGPSWEPFGQGTPTLTSLASPIGSAPRGIFFAGWHLLLQSEAASLAAATDPGELQRLRDGSEAVAAAFLANLDNGGSPFLMAYPQQSWPVDSVVAMAALRRADSVTGLDHDALIERWIERALELADPSTGLLPHRTDPLTGSAIEGPRGSSQGIIQRMWPIVDPRTTHEMYSSFRSEFLGSRFGFVGITEYPDGIDGGSDVDSGPLVLGLSASASAVAIGAARANGDDGLASTLSKEAEVFGAPVTVNGSKRYALGLVPIGDAFLTWSRTTPAAPSGDYEQVRATWPLLLSIPWSLVASAWLVAYLHRRRTTARSCPPAGYPTLPLPGIR